ncbi:hypothetical protein, partial [Cupriavidus gilardii]
MIEAERLGPGQGPEGAVIGLVDNIRIDLADAHGLARRRRWTVRALMRSACQYTAASDKHRRGGGAALAGQGIAQDCGKDAACRSDKPRNVACKNYSAALQKVSEGVSAACIRGKYSRRRRDGAQAAGR